MQFWSLVADDLGALAVSFLVLGGAVGLGEVLYRVVGWPPRASRRIVHAGAGLFMVALPYLFEHAAGVYLLGLSFVLINGITGALGWLRGMHPHDHETRGTVTFPLALIAVLPFCWGEERQFILQTAFLVLAVADPLAAAVGESYARRQISMGSAVKSPAGSLTFLVIGWLLILGGLLVFGPAPFGWPLLVLAGLAALVTAGVEALGGRGWDNFFIVTVLALILIVWQQHPGWLGAMSAGTIGGVLFGLISWKLEFLTPSGAVAGGLFAAALVGLGGWAWAAPGFAFFFLSSLLSKLGTDRKGPYAAVGARESRRDASQVYANGAAAWLLVVAYVLEPHPWIYWGFVGSLAAAAADTWAAEIGPLFRRQAHMVLSGRPVPAGTSGGVSWPGTLAGAVGAVVIWTAAWSTAAEPLVAGPLTSFVGVVGGGMTGSLVDSLAGAAVQAVYRNRRTGELTEEPPGPREQLRPVRGWPWIDNNFVNMLGTTAGAAASILLMFLL